MRERIPKRDLEAMFQSNIDRVESMSEAELDAELRSSGLDPDAIVNHGFQRVCEALREVSAERNALRDLLQFARREYGVFGSLSGETLLKIDAAIKKR